MLLDVFAHLDRRHFGTFLLTGTLKAGALPSTTAGMPRALEGSAENFGLAHLAHQIRDGEIFALGVDAGISRSVHDTDLVVAVFLDNLHRLLDVRQQQGRNALRLRNRCGGLGIDQVALDNTVQRLHLLVSLSQFLVVAFENLRLELVPLAGLVELVLVGLALRLDQLRNLFGAQAKTRILLGLFSGILRRLALLLKRRLQAGRIFIPIQVKSVLVAVLGV